MGKAKKPTTPKSVDELVLHALKTAATKPNAKWTGAGAAAIFNTKEANHEAALAECTKADAPLLKQVGKGGALTAAGFERIAAALPAEEVRSVYDQLRDELPEDQVGVVARAMARLVPTRERVEFIKGVIRRTQAAAPELNPVLEEAIVAEKVEQEASVAAAAKRRAADEALKQALDRTKALIEQHRQNRLDALRREYEAECGHADELPAHGAPPKTAAAETGQKPEAKVRGPEPATVDGKEYRRHVADQFAASWRAAWDAKKAEARDYVESAMWNIRGLKLVGEPGQSVTFDAMHHECPDPVSTGQRVTVVRPGWALEESQGEYVPLKVLVSSA